MDALRWILLFLGIVILLAIYIFGRRSDEASMRQDTSRDEPRFDDAPELDEPVAPEDEWDIIPVQKTGGHTEPEAVVDETVPIADGLSDKAMPDATSDNAPTPPLAEQKSPDTPKAKPASEASSETNYDDILIIHVVTRDEALTGAVLAEAFDELELSLDQQGMYRREDKRGGSPLFGVLNMVKPGTFSTDRLDSVKTPGISLFMTLPGPEVPMTAFRAMSECARQLAERFNARLEDETHSNLSRQTLTHMEERVRQFIQHRARDMGSRQ
ncbi:cell division protein ZipA C-terminal FtsZ-binding domain-containing protein [Acidihalobacter prosperus]